jgi:hypothetical protein
MDILGGEGIILPITDGEKSYGKRQEKMSRLKDGIFEDSSSDVLWNHCIC